MLEGRQLLPYCSFSRSHELACTYHTALSQVMYTSMYSPLLDEDTNVTPGFSQHNAYYWLLMRRDRLEACFPQTYKNFCS